MPQTLAKFPIISSAFESLFFKVGLARPRVLRSTRIASTTHHAMFQIATFTPCLVPQGGPLTGSRDWSNVSPSLGSAPACSSLPPTTRWLVLCSYNTESNGFQVV